MRRLRKEERQQRGRSQLVREVGVEVSLGGGGADSGDEVAVRVREEEDRLEQLRGRRWTGRWGSGKGGRGKGNGRDAEG